MKRKVIEINEALCNGCGDCIEACHEGALQMINGKAKLVSDVYCDGLGDCVGDCPQGAITIIEREAEAYDQSAVDARLKALGRPAHPDSLEAGGGGCPGSAPRVFEPVKPAAGGGCPGARARTILREIGLGGDEGPSSAPVNHLRQWPVQLRLVPPQAPFLRGADLVICADCVPFAVPDFHERYLKDQGVVVACPKLDPSDANQQRIQALMAHSGARSVKIVIMEVPCCRGLAGQTVAAWEAHCPDIPCEVHIVGVQGGVRVQPIAPPSR